VLTATSQLTKSCNNSTLDSPQSSLLTVLRFGPRKRKTKLKKKKNWVKKGLLILKRKREKNRRRRRRMRLGEFRSSDPLSFLENDFPVPIVIAALFIYLFFIDASKRKSGRKYEKKKK
ncbi:hypothetical protein V8G54_002038, partial [Vigna mungo]